MFYTTNSDTPNNFAVEKTGGTVCNRQQLANMLATETPVNANTT